MNRRLAFHILLLAALFLCIRTTSAYNVVDEIVEFVLDKRQNNGTTATQAPSTSDTPPTTTAATTHTTAIHTTVVPTTTTAVNHDTTVPQTTNQAQSSPGPAGETTTPPTAGNAETTPADIPQSTTAAVDQQLTTRFSTQTRGVATVTLTISSMVAVSTYYTEEVHTIVDTPTAGLSSGSGNNNGSGGSISAGKKNVIIGVVVGVGGAIIIGALLVVAFRLRKRKSTGAADSDDLQGSPVTANPARQQDAFQATLDQYHKPPGTVNPSANF